ncbi:MAG: TIGR00289 family protein [Candidatus Terraquivivens tikiterensis]|uniref:TIGR00289 family protein n=1 Tax=Candidatus Terraquivivens tikiterensis TaxID=1980982 RepID=A0A2R7YA82_9ARCH|nr:MAG: TIGR00289 family protein [Candidatus Terraquivivens tikiterensis]
MRVAVLFSGGKDSTYALYKAMLEGNAVECLVTVIPRNPESWMFHRVNIEMTRHQADAVGIKQVMVPSMGIKEEEVEDLKVALEGLRGIEGLVSGTVASRYQRSRIERLCSELGLRCIMPLWGMEPERLLREQHALGFETIVTSVSADGLDESWLGRKLDGVAIDELCRLSERFGINVCFEGGEAETFVLDCPIFKKSLRVKGAVKKWLGDRGVYEILSLECVSKN